MTTSAVKFKLIEVDFPEFSTEELKGFREAFMKFDLDNNGQLEVFELHQMYESIGQTKTNAELVQLIKECDTTASGGIDYKEYLTILLKDKKGLLPGGMGIASSFAQIVAKQHDESKETGKKANIFEQKMADLAKQKQEEEKIRQQNEKRKKQNEMKRKIAQEEAENARKEEEKKKKTAEKLAKFKNNLGKR
eukprot:TRINITY_DN1058_c0_g1_i1.p1 TRINITY_DN1058_c0_g1~~TRINITY_DN1058_c0_g1_i1.p1  ORF type:complete len:192 (-),score=65.74 TRINITY_DN1058_c0_g1_i1:23-598(-)